MPPLGYSSVVPNQLPIMYGVTMQPSDWGEWIVELWQKFVSWISPILQQVGTWLSQLWQQIVPLVSRLWQEAGHWLSQHRQPFLCPTTT